MKLEITTTATEDDLRYTLETQCSTKQLIDFAISLGTNISNDIDYYEGLYKRLHKMRSSWEEDK